MTDFLKGKFKLMFKKSNFNGSQMVFIALLLVKYKHFGGSFLRVTLSFYLNHVGKQVVSSSSQSFLLHAHFPVLKMLGPVRILMTSSRCSESDEPSDSSITDKVNLQYR